jgi:hypothetical protein
MRRTLISLVLLLCIFAGLQGCRSTDDVSDRDALWGGYKRGDVYTLHNFDVFLMQRRFVLGLGGKTMFVAPSSINLPGPRFLDAPESVQAWQSGNFVPQSAARVVGVVPKGTRIQAARLDLVKEWSLMFGSITSLDIWGEVLDGPFAGREALLVSLSDYAGRSPEGAILYEPVCVVFCEFKSAE